MRKHLEKYPFLWEWKEISEYIKNFDKEKKIEYLKELLARISSFGKERNEKLTNVEKFIIDNNLVNYFKKETIKNVLLDESETNGYIDFLRIINKNAETIKKELSNLITKIDSYVKVETLLNENTFLRYKDQLKHGYYDENFERDIESIEKIEDKIIFLNYILSQVDERKESMKFTVTETENKIKNYEVYSKFTTLQELYNKLSNFEEELGGYRDSQGFLTDLISFWQEQLDLKTGKVRNNEIDFQFFNLCNYDLEGIREHLNKIDDKLKKIEYLQWLQKEVQYKLRIEWFPYDLQNETYEVALKKAKDFVDKLENQFVKIENIDLAGAKWIEIKDLNIQQLMEFAKFELKFWVDVHNGQIPQNYEEPKEQKNMDKKDKLPFRITCTNKMSINDIKELFKLLLAEGLVAEDTVRFSSAIIRDCFIKEDGTRYKYDSVRKTNTKGKSINYDKIKNVVDKINKKKA